MMDEYKGTVTVTVELERKKRGRQKPHNHRAKTRQLVDAMMNGGFRSFEDFQEAAWKEAVRVTNAHDVNVAAAKATFEADQLPNAVSGNKPGRVHPISVMFAARWKQKAAVADRIKAVEASDPELAAKRKRWATDKMASRERLAAGERVRPYEPRPEQRKTDAEKLANQLAYLARRKTERTERNKLARHAAVKAYREGRHDAPELLAYLAKFPSANMPTKPEPTQLQRVF